MRRLLKFLHTMGAMGLFGAMASLLAIMLYLPAATTPADQAARAGAMAAIASWVFMPSLGVTLIAGLLAIGFNRAYHNAGWAWVKLIAGVLVFEGGFVNIVGPIQEEARRTASLLAGQVADRLDPAALAAAASAERNSLWALGVVAVANVVLGIWRPRLTRIPD